MRSSNLSDEKLIEIIREKDKELYSEIIKRYKNKLSHYLRKFIRDSDELEDVLQVVFIKVYKNLHGFNVEKKFSSWIYRIAHNEAINQIKKYSKERLFLDDEEQKIVDKKIDINDSIDKKMLKKEIEQYLNAIKQKYQEPIILFYFEQKSYEEISDILRIPKSTVGTLILRGKKILKQNLQKTMYAKK
ncbi:RNA polymerase sigma factor [bacterium]|nr:RNA polymerase sigma factor [bacterium]